MDQDTLAHDSSRTKRAEGYEGQRCIENESSSYTIRRYMLNLWRSFFDSSPPIESWGCHRKVPLILSRILGHSADIVPAPFPSRYLHHRELPPPKLIASCFTDLGTHVLDRVILSFLTLIWPCKHANMYFLQHPGAQSIHYLQQGR